MAPLLLSFGKCFPVLLRQLSDKTQKQARGLPRDLKAKATVMQSTAAVVEICLTEARTVRAAAGPSKARVCILFLTFVGGTPASHYILEAIPFANVFQHFNR